MEKFLEFLKKSVTQYHAVCELEKILIEAGFNRLYEENKYDVLPNSKYYIIRNNSSIMAFTTPKDIKNTSLNIVASHTDSPTFKIKPNNKLTSDKYSQLNVEVYGGPIYSSFFDRPLSLAGRAFVNSDNGVNEVLVNIDRDLLVIPNECIHFNRDVNDGKKYNPQVDLLPLLGQENEDLIDLLSLELNVSKKEILSFDLQVYNRFRGSIIGANKEYYMAPQIDNLACAYGSLLGFINSKNDYSFNVYVAFDNEEVGSRTKQGAASTFLYNNLLRITNALNGQLEDLMIACSNGLLVSADNAHAVHPNDVGKTDRINNVYMNNGIVIKYNANQAYTTDALSASILKKIFIDNNIKYQEFTNRSDVRGGSTLGAISIEQLSIASVDIGLAQLAMHSACETAGVKDLEMLVNATKSFYNAKISKTNNSYKIK